MLLMTNWWPFFCSQWMSFGQNLLQLVFRQICETCNLRVFFGFIFVACWIRPERSTPIGKFASSSLVSSIFQGERKLHCNLTGRRLWSQVNKMLTSSYLRTGGSTGLIYGKHACYVVNMIFISLQPLFTWHEEVVLAPRVPSYSGVPGEAQF